MTPNDRYRVDNPCRKNARMSGDNRRLSCMLIDINVIGGWPNP